MLLGSEILIYAIHMQAGLSRFATAVKVPVPSETQPSLLWVTQGTRLLSLLNKSGMESQMAADRLTAYDP